MENNEIKLKGAYDGITTTKLGITTIKFKFPYSEIVHYIKTLSLIGIDILLNVKFAKGSETELGHCRVKKLQIDREGEAVLWLEGECINQGEILSMIDRTVLVKLTQVQNGT